MSPFEAPRQLKRTTRRRPKQRYTKRTTVTTVTERRGTMILRKKRTKVTEFVYDVVKRHRPRKFKARKAHIMQGQRVRPTVDSSLKIAQNAYRARTKQLAMRGYETPQKPGQVASALTLTTTSRERWSAFFKRRTAHSVGHELAKAHLSGCSTTRRFDVGSTLFSIDAVMDGHDWPYEVVIHKPDDDESWVWVRPSGVVTPWSAARSCQSDS